MKERKSLNIFLDLMKEFSWRHNVMNSVDDYMMIHWNLEKILRKCYRDWEEISKTTEPPDNVNCDIAIYANDTTLYSKRDQASDLWQQLELASELESDLGQEVTCWFQSWKLSWFYLTNPTTLVLFVWKWMDLFLRKNNILRCWGWLSVLNWIGPLTLSLLLKLSPRKSEL